jgi:hypothetical protein
MVTKQDPPWPLRIPKEWKPEIERGAQEVDKSQHAFLVGLIRMGLDMAQMARSQDLTTLTAEELEAWNNPPALAERGRVWFDQTGNSKRLQRDEVEPRFKKGGKK